MQNPTNRDDLIHILDDLKRRLSAVERINRDRTEYYNSDKSVLETGKAWIDGEGNKILAQNDSAQGLVYPHDMTQWIVPTTQSITSTTWTTIAECETQVPAGDIYQFSAALICPAGTTVGVRILASGVPYGTQTQAGEVSGVVCEWLHPYTIGWGEQGANAGKSAVVFLQYQVQRTAGVGTITAYTPRSLMIRSSRFTANESATTPFTFS